jgi:nucleoside-diphosphate-sugar epimerase
MKVFITGATGFVGAHTALALLQAGHQVRLLVRNAGNAQRYFAQHGFAVDDFLVADIRDEARIRPAMQGCDAVLHAAAIVALDPARAQETYDNNVEGMKAVVGSACELGIRNIVYVSSLSALFWPGLPRTDESTPLAPCKEPYSRSKRDSDEYVRALQARGYPIQISYPSAVIGPDDPKLSEANHGLITFVTSGIPMTTTGFQMVDVRDLAQAHRYLLEHPQTSGFESARYIIGGHYYPWKEFRIQLEAGLGRRILGLYCPAALLRGMGATVDALQRVVRFKTQVSAEAMSFVTQWSPADSSKYLRQSGLQFRDGEETFADTFRWMAEAGHLPRRDITRLASA